MISALCTNDYIAEPNSGILRGKHVKVHMYDGDNVARQTKLCALPSPVGDMQRGHTTTLTAKLVGLSNCTSQLLLTYQNRKFQTLCPL